jgi:hypothetical protein
MIDFISMSSTTKPATKTSDVNAQILASLDKLNDAHLAAKPICFAKGLPFYTCIDSENGLGTKELSNGQITLVKRDYDFDRDEAEETFIRKIK